MQAIMFYWSKNCGKELEYTRCGAVAHDAHDV